MDWLVPLLAFLSVIMIGGAILSGRSGRKAIRKRLQDLDAQSAKVDTASQPAPLSTLGRIARAFSLGTPSVSLSEHLARAGYHGTSASTVYLGAKFMLLMLGLGGASALVYARPMPLHIKMLIVIGAAAVLYFLPNVLVAIRRRNRTVEIRHHLPDAVDLLEICVSAGMGLNMAWNSVADEIRRVSTVLGDEMALTNLEINLGAPRATAMRHMAERTGAEELSSLVALLVQSDRFGTKVSDTLKVFAQTMREERTNHAQESAEKMAVKLLFPMVLFIFPAVLIVMVGPAAIQLFQVLLNE